MKNYIINDLFGYQNYSYLDSVIQRVFEYMGLSSAKFSIIFVSETEIQKINREYRQIDRVTDVISFALFDGEKIIDDERTILGDIYICIPRMKEQAKEYGHSEKRELSFLVVHGLLHLLGYDHMTKKEEEIMFKIQDEILNLENIIE